MRALTILLAFATLPVLAGPLNDTGIDFCRDHATGTDTTVTPTTTCATAQGGQDAQYGRDPAALSGALTKTGAGAQGFDFTKIANNGTTLPASATLGNGATDWACTYDNNTGLMWEVKVDDNSHLRHKHWSYSWYDSAHNYGGNAGSEDNGTCLASGRCDTEKFVADVNAAGLCGHNTGWRMPTLDELANIVHYGAFPTIDTEYFPNTVDEYYWSGSPAAHASNSAWAVYFNYGSADPDGRANSSRVRLVRGQ